MVNYALSLPLSSLFENVQNCAPFGGIGESIRGQNNRSSDVPRGLA